MEEIIHDQVELEDFEYDFQTKTLRYPCPCGDEFIVTIDELSRGECYARCPSCSLVVQVIFCEEDLNKFVELD